MAMAQIPAKFFHTENGNPAWHGLGDIIPSDISHDLEKVLSYADMDYDVVKLEQINAMTGDKIPGEFGLYNERTKQFYGNCKGGYNPLNNYQSLKFIHELMSDQNIYIDSIAEWPNGYVAVNYRLLETEVVKNDDHIIYLQAFFGHDGLKAINYFQSHTRMVCKNTVYKAMKTAENAGEMFKVKHTKNAEIKMANATALIRAMRDEAKTYIDRLKLLSRKTLTASQVKTILDKIYGEPKLLKNGEIKDNPRIIVEQLFERNDGNNGINLIRGTAYNMYNALTEYTTHETRVNIHGHYNEADRPMIEASKRILNQINSVNKTNPIDKFFNILETI